MVRYSPQGALFDSKGASLFSDSTETLLYALGMLNSKVSGVFLKVLSPAYEYKVGHVANVPLLWGNEDTVIEYVRSCIDVSKDEWDAFETSWDFQQHPLVRLKDNMRFTVTDGDCKSKSYFLQGAYRAWENECENRFAQLKANEDELNCIFIDIYGLQDELSPEVEDKDVTVRKADLQRDIKSLLSYAVGCMFGRYSLDMSRRLAVCRT